MERPNADILVVAGNRELPIYPSEVYDQGIADTTPIGTGPGDSLTRRTPVLDQRMAFAANPDYWGGAPLPRRVPLRHRSRTPETRKAAFRTGQAHYGLPTVRNEEAGRAVGERSRHERDE